MKITQAVLKYCNIYGITFNDKYSNIKSIVTSDNYNSKFTSDSQTSTILLSDTSYYNRVEKCKLFNCNVENGHFLNSNFIGLSGVTNYINDGYFSGCTFSGYTINGGKFYNCVVHSNNVWENGYWDNANGTVDFRASWHDGVWNRGRFASDQGWTGGTFNGGTFEYPAVWYNGIANGGLFSGATWWRGLVRNATFMNSQFNGGVFNSGRIINSAIQGGTFNGGNISGSVVTAYYNHTIFNGGSLSGGSLSDMRVEIRGANLNYINTTYCTIYATNSIGTRLDGATIYGGIFKNCNIESGDIYNCTFSNLSGTTGPSSSLIIHNGTFNNSYLQNAT
jgi:uncharacterized protein YjbI with pentapeptide repeats